MRPRKLFTAEEADLIYQLEDRGLGVRAIANHINKERGVFGASLLASKRKSRSVHKDTIHRFLRHNRRKTGPSQNPGAATEAATRRKTQDQLDVRDPEPQVESSEDRVATMGSMNAVPVTGERGPLGNEHDGKVA